MNCPMARTTTRKGANQVSVVNERCFRLLELARQFEMQHLDDTPERRGLTLKRRRGVRRHLMDTHKTRMFVASDAMSRD